MRGFVILVGLILGGSACALESGESSAGVGGTGGSGGLGGTGVAGTSGTGAGGTSGTGVGGTAGTGAVVDLVTCAVSVPTTVPATLGGNCTRCLCTNEIDRATVIACDGACWDLVLCAATSCGINNSDVTCILNNCMPGSSVGPATAVAPIVRGCSQECPAPAGTN